MQIAKTKIDHYEWELSLCCDICDHVQRQRMIINAHPMVEQRLRVSLMKTWAMHNCNPRAKKRAKHDNASEQKNRPEPPSEKDSITTASAQTSFTDCTAAG